MMRIAKHESGQRPNPDAGALVPAGGTRRHAIGQIGVTMLGLEMSRNSKKKRNKPVPLSDFGPLDPATGNPSRPDADEIVIEHGMTDAAGARRARVTAQCPFDRYFQRGQLSRDADENLLLYDIGEQYRRLTYVAGLNGMPIAQNLMRVDQGTPEPSETATIALEKIRQADKQLGEAQASCVRKVCVEGWSAEAWAVSRRLYRSGVGLEFLRDALRMLARRWQKSA